MNILQVFKDHGIEVTSIEPKDFGTVYRACGLKLLEQARIAMFELGHNTPVSCHREYESCEAFMIVWNKTK